MKKVLSTIFQKKINFLMPEKLFKSYFLALPPIISTQNDAAAPVQTVTS
jgi:hypothetical protein